MYDIWWWLASDLEKYWQGLYGADLKTYFFSSYTLKFIREPISVPTCRGITASPALLYQHTPRLPSGCMTLFKRICCIRSFSKKWEISPRMYQEEGLLSGPERSQFSSWRGSDSMLPGQKNQKEGRFVFFFSKNYSPFLGQTVSYVPLRAWWVCCPEFPRLSHLQVSAPLSTKAQPASLSNPSYHSVQENSTHALKETLVGALDQTAALLTSFRGPRHFKSISYCEGVAVLWSDETVCPNIWQTRQTSAIKLPALRYKHVALTYVH